MKRAKPFRIERRAIAAAVQTKVGVASYDDGFEPKTAASGLPTRIGGQDGPTGKAPRAAEGDGFPMPWRTGSEIGNRGAEDRKAAFANHRGKARGERAAIPTGMGCCGDGRFAEADRCTSIALIADDVARLLAGRTSFPREMWGDAR